MKYKVMDEKGRSMIEMLGVLAIVGVLSVAGIAGYSKAMAKYKVNKLMDQVSTLSANIKTLFASVGSYSGLTGNERAFKLGLFPDDMTKTCKGTYAAGCIKNGMNGNVTVGSTGAMGKLKPTDTEDSFIADGKGFTIVFEGLTKDACVAMFTSDWGGAAGFKSIQGTDGDAKTPADLATSGVYTLAQSACKAPQNATNFNDNSYSVTWTFY